MLSSSCIVFPPFHLEITTGQLWRGEQLLRLRPQAAAVFQYLLERPHQVVSKDELFAALWPGVTVSSSVLKTYIWEIRRALNDQQQPARFIETIARRGYRFIGPVQSPASRVQSLSPAPNSQHPVPLLVGRDTELIRLQSLLERACNGKRQIVFVSGEAGIGKTTLIEAFLQNLASQRVQRPKSKVQSQDDWSLDPRRQTLDTHLWVASGQCIEQYGTSEAYMPVLEALGRLCRTTLGPQTISLLRQYAPTWLLQLPAVLTPEEREQLQREVHGATRERMLREMAEALEALTADTPLVLSLEDLHWSDPSTLDLISYVARRHEPARLLLIGTYRPVEALREDHPLKTVIEELFLHQHGQELPLSLLDQDAVETYVATRLPVEKPTPRPIRQLAQAVYQRTEGHPLFMVNIVEELLSPKEGQDAGIAFTPEEIFNVVPANIRQMIEKQFARLTPAEHQLLEAASIAGIDFSAACIGTATESDVIQVETLCESLVRRRLFLQSREHRVATERRLSKRYQFRHTLYRDVVSTYVTTARQRQLHFRIGEWKEAAYGKQSRTIAAELAMHFECGRDFSRAIHYLRLAGENATRQSAHSEAVNLFTKGLELLRTLPHSDERIQQEIRLYLSLGTPLIALKGYAAREVEHAFTQVQNLCEQSGNVRYLVSALLGLGATYLNRAEFPTAQALAERVLRQTSEGNEPERALWAHILLGHAMIHTGEFASAQNHFTHSITLYDAQRHNPHTSDVAQDPGVHCRSYLAELLWWRGYPDQARQSCQEALAQARSLSHPYSRAITLASAAILHNWLREHHAAQEFSQELIVLATEQGFPHWLAVGMLRHGWTLAEQGKAAEGVEQMRQGLAVFQSTGAKLSLSVFLCELAWALGRAGQRDEGLALLAEAQTVIDKTGERLYEVESYRMKGELGLRRKSQIKSLP